MAVSPDFDMKEIHKFLVVKHQQLEEKVFKTLQYVGEKFVRDARKMKKVQGGFGDVTGNLRSSIGYIIFKDGIPVSVNFRVAREGKDGTLGKEIGNRFAKRFSNSKGFQLVGVAGMKYAKFVEDRGLNVISYQADLAFVDLKKMVTKIKIS